MSEPGEREYALASFQVHVPDGEQRAAFLELVFGSDVVPVGAGAAARAPSDAALGAAHNAHDDVQRDPDDPDAIYTVTTAGLRAALTAAYAVDFPAAAREPTRWLGDHWGSRAVPAPVGAPGRAAPEPPEDHASFEEARAAGFPALRRTLEKRRRADSAPDQGGAGGPAPSSPGAAAGEPTDDHASFEDARAAGFAALGRALDARRIAEAIERLSRWERAACYPGVDHAEVRRDLRAVLAALRSASPVAAPDNEFAWLIDDTRVADGPVYYGGVGEIDGTWTRDHMKAVRYVRKEDAYRALIGLPNGWHLIGCVVEHGWARATVAAPTEADGEDDGLERDKELDDAWHRGFRSGVKVNRLNHTRGAGEAVNADSQ
jgi:hypothetical protein